MAGPPSLPDRVVVVIVPREQFSCAWASYQQIRATVPDGVAIVVVDGAFPPELHDAFAAEAARGAIAFVPSPVLLPPNQARNLARRAIGAAHGARPYVVFVDNDVFPAHGWLQALVACADDTGADLVGPLVLEGPAGRERVHTAGGDARIEVDDQGRRTLVGQNHHLHARLADVEGSLRRTPTHVVEFHAMLCRTATLDRLGPFDEALLSLNEHLDLCLRVREAGGLVMFEPAARVSYGPPWRYDGADVGVRLVRWSERWNRDSLAHFTRTWRLDEGLAQNDTVAAFGRTQRRLAGAGTVEDGTLGLYAQTPPQLYRQMQRAGYGEPALRRAHAAVALATDLFGDRVRGSGKPFLCHLVGTASVLVEAKAPPRLVAAALVHATYQVEDLGRRRDAGLADAVRAAIGDKAEQIVSAYAKVPWDGPAIARHAAQAADLDALTADVVRLRLANEVDDHLDLGILHCANAEARQARIASEHLLEHGADLAWALQLPTVAVALEMTVGPCLDGQVPAFLRTDSAWSRRSRRPAADGARSERSADGSLVRLVSRTVRRAVRGLQGRRGDRRPPGRPVAR